MGPDEPVELLQLASLPDEHVVRHRVGVLGRRDRLAVRFDDPRVDEIERAVSRDIAIQNLDRGSRMLRDIGNSLQRIDEDTFGSCLHCEQEITLRRLKAVPWAQLCLPCQEAADRGDETASGS